MGKAQIGIEIYLVVLPCAILLSGCGGGSSTQSMAERRPAVPPPRVTSGPEPQGAIPAYAIAPDRSPLKAIIEQFDVERLKALLEGGADPNLRGDDDATAWPPVAQAMRGPGGSAPTYGAGPNAKEMADLLLQHGADANARLCDFNIPECNLKTGMTLLMYAAALGDEDLLSLLTRRGADDSLRDWRGLTASDYWGVKGTEPESWCLEPSAGEDVMRVAKELVAETADYFLAPGVKERLAATSRDVAIMRDARLCERAAVAYARHRNNSPYEPAPRMVLPVVVVRVGPVMVVDDRQEHYPQHHIFDASWRFLGWIGSGS